VIIVANGSGQPSDLASRRLRDMKGEPTFLSDWERAVFVHYAVPSHCLQPIVPYQLDLLDGVAYVSVVAFTMNRLRPRRGGRLAALLCRPIATHGFLNLRTYVIHDGEPGIFFLAEWLPNRLSVQLGPMTFGLPYRFGYLNYVHRHECGEIAGRVTAGDGSGSFAYRADVDPGCRYRPCAAGSRDAFVLERYTAFTKQGATCRRFRIWHKPWPQTPIPMTVTNDSLLAATGSWFQHARPIGTNYSPGVRDVWMSRPMRLYPSVAGGQGRCSSRNPGMSHRRVKQITVRVSLQLASAGCPYA